MEGSLYKKNEVNKQELKKKKGVLQMSSALDNTCINWGEGGEGVRRDASVSWELKRRNRGS